MSLAKAYRLSSYDAAYLELALREGLPLSTLDKNLLFQQVQCGTHPKGMAAKLAAQVKRGDIDGVRSLIVA